MAATGKCGEGLAVKIECGCINFLKKLCAFFLELKFFTENKIFFTSESADKRHGLAVVAEIGDQKE